MPTLAIVHGARHGGWRQRETALALRAAGHEAYTPTHTSVGERAHQGSEHITLETHIRDVCGGIEGEELSKVIRGGHSYGGRVTTGVADRPPSRIKALVDLDAFVPENGQPLTDLLRPALPAEAAEGFLGAFRGTALEGRRGWRVSKLPCSHDVMVDMSQELAAEPMTLA